MCIVKINGTIKVSETDELFTSKTLLETTSFIHWLKIEIDYLTCEQNKKILIK
jgi:hypothetical protein